MFKKKVIAKKNGLRLLIVDRNAPESPQFTSLDIENSLPSRARNCLQGVPLKFFFSKFLILSPGLSQRRSQPLTAAGWRHRLPIKNMTAHYNSQNSVSFHFGFVRKPENVCKHE